VLIVPRSSAQHVELGDISFDDLRDGVDEAFSYGIDSSSVTTAHQPSKINALVSTTP
jgi:hypothetical protein